MKHRIFDKSVRALIGAFVLLFAFGASPAFAQQDSLEGFQAEESVEGEYQFSPEELKQLQELYGAEDTESALPSSLDDYSGVGAYGDYPYESPYGSSGLDPTSMGLLPLLLSGFGGMDTAKSVALFFGAYLLILLLIAVIFFVSVFKKYKRFSREQALVFGWNMMKKHIWLFVLISVVQLLVWAVFGVFAYLSTRFGPGQVSLPWIAGMIAYVLLAFFFFLLFSVGLTKISLKAHDGKAFGVSDLFTGVGLVFKYLLAGIVNFVIIVGPFIVLRVATGFMKDLFSETVLLIGGLVAALLLAIPVSILLMKFYLWGIVVVDKGLWPLAALKLSSQYTARAKTDVALFNILLLGINLIGSNVPLMLGLFVSTPVALLAYAHMYRQLEKG